MSFEEWDKHIAQPTKKPSGFEAWDSSLQATATLDRPSPTKLTTEELTQFVREQAQIPRSPQETARQQRLQQVIRARGPLPPHREAEVQAILQSPAARTYGELRRPVTMFGVDRLGRPVRELLGKLTGDIFWASDESAANEAWQRMKIEDQQALAAGGYATGAGPEVPQAIGAFTNFIGEIAVTETGLTALGLLGKGGKATRAGNWLVKKVLGQTIKPGRARLAVATALRSAPGSTALWGAYRGTKAISEGKPAAAVAKEVAAGAALGLGFSAAHGVLAGVAPPVMAAMGRLYETNRLKYHRVMANAMTKLGKTRAAKAHANLSKGRGFVAAQKATRAEIAALPKAKPTAKVRKVARTLSRRHLELEAQGKTPLEAEQIILAEQRAASQLRGAEAGRARIEAQRAAGIKPASVRQPAAVAAKPTQQVVDQALAIPEPPIAKHLRTELRIKEGLPTNLVVEQSKDYADTVRQLTLLHRRQQTVFEHRAHLEAEQWRKAVPNEKLEDLRVLAEKGEFNLRTRKPRAQIQAELTAKDKAVLNSYRQAREKSRLAVNKYLEGSGITEYIKFLENYFPHFYEPMGKAARANVAKWAKSSPNAKRRKLPNLEEAEKLGLVPVTHNLADAHELWARVNFRVATNIALLKKLPAIVNDDGVPIIMSPQKAPPGWPTLDHYAIRKTYAKAVPGRGTLLWQGKVAVDPQAHKYLSAIFDAPLSGTAIRAIEALNAMSKSFRVALSLFHHQTEAFSGVGGIGLRIFGLTGKEAQKFGKQFYISPLKAGEQLRQSPEFMQDAIMAGVQTGAVRGEGIRTIGGMLERLDKDMSNLFAKPGASLPDKTQLWLGKQISGGTLKGYKKWQSILWDNVDRLRLLDYYENVQFGINAVEKAIRRNPNSKLAQMTTKQIKETVAKSIQHNYGGIEWLDTILRDPKAFQATKLLALSADWTIAQILKGGEPFSRNPLLRKLGRRHWARYITGVLLATEIANYMFNGHGTWENEIGHRWDVDVTNVVRLMPWHDPEDKSRYYVSLGKAGRELIGWVTNPFRTFTNKLSPGGHIALEQVTGTAGPEWEMPWRAQDLEWYDNVMERAKAVAEHWVPFSFHANNAAFAFPKRKGMTTWKAMKAYEQIYNSIANQAMGGPRAIATRYTPKNISLLVRGKDRLFADIRSASEANEVNWKRSQSAALSKVKTRYYRFFWQAVKDQDVELSNRYADALFVLQTTPKGFIESAIRREIPPEEIDRGVTAFEGAVDRDPQSR